MNRTVCILGLVLLFVALVAGWSVQAYGTHPVPDNMCGAHTYGNCYNDSDWIRGWYDYLRHTTSENSDSRQEGWRSTSNGISYSGSPSIPEATAIPAPQTRGQSDRTCHVQSVRVNSVTYQRCVSETEFWCDRLATAASHSDSAREYVENQMPSGINC